MIGQRIERIKERMREDIAERMREDIASQARSEGLQSGLQKGLREGELQGRRQERRAVLLELIEHKFGRVDPELETRLQEASLEDLLSWSRKVLAASTLDEVFADRR